MTQTRTLLSLMAGVTLEALVAPRMATCPICGKEFERPKRSRRKECAKRCYWTARKRRLAKERKTEFERWKVEGVKVKDGRAGMGNEE